MDRNSPNLSQSLFTTTLIPSTPLAHRNRISNNFRTLTPKISNTIFGYIDFCDELNPTVVEQSYPVTDRVTKIGRDNTYSIRLNDLRVSRSQCELIIQEENGYSEAILHNLSNNSKTTIDGKPLRKGEKIVLHDSNGFKISKKFLVWRSASVTDTVANSTFTVDNGDEEENPNKTQTSDMENNLENKGDFPTGSNDISTLEDGDETVSFLEENGNDISTEQEPELNSKEMEIKEIETATLKVNEEENEGESIKDVSQTGSTSTKVVINDKFPVLKLTRVSLEHVNNQAEEEEMAEPNKKTEAKITAPADKAKPSTGKKIPEKLAVDDLEDETEDSEPEEVAPIPNARKGRAAKITAPIVKVKPSRGKKVPEKLPVDELEEDSEPEEVAPIPNPKNGRAIKAPEEVKVKPSRGRKGKNVQEKLPVVEVEEPKETKEPVSFVEENDISTEEESESNSKKNENNEIDTATLKVNEEENESESMQDVSQTASTSTKVVINDKFPVLKLTRVSLENVAVNNQAEEEVMAEPNKKTEAKIAAPSEKVKSSRGKKVPEKLPVDDLEDKKEDSEPEEVASILNARKARAAKITAPVEVKVKPSRGRKGKNVPEKLPAVEVEEEEPEVSEPEEPVVSNPRKGRAAKITASAVKVKSTKGRKIKNVPKTLPVEDFEEENEEVSKPEEPVVSNPRKGRAAKITAPEEVKVKPSRGRKGENVPVAEVEEEKEEISEPEEAAPIHNAGKGRAAKITAPAEKVKPSRGKKVPEKLPVDDLENEKEDSEQQQVAPILNARKGRAAKVTAPKEVTVKPSRGRKGKNVPETLSVAEVEEEKEELEEAEEDSVVSKPKKGRAAKIIAPAKKVKPSRGKKVPEKLAVNNLEEDSEQEEVAPLPNPRKGRAAKITAPEEVKVKPSRDRKGKNVAETLPVVQVEEEKEEVSESEEDSVVSKPRVKSRKGKSAKTLAPEGKKGKNVALPVPEEAVEEPKNKAKKGKGGKENLEKTVETKPKRGKAKQDPEEPMEVNTSVPDQTTKSRGRQAKKVVTKEEVPSGSRKRTKVEEKTASPPAKRALRTRGAKV